MNMEVGGIQIMCCKQVEMITQLDAIPFRRSIARVIERTVHGTVLSLSQRQQSMSNGTGPMTTGTCPPPANQITEPDLASQSGASKGRCRVAPRGRDDFHGFFRMFREEMTLLNGST